MGKKKDPSKGVVGRGHQVLPALRSGGGDPPKGDGAKGHLVLPAIRSRAYRHGRVPGA